MERFESYIICTSPRSGSTLLCKLLSNTGVAGVPGSHFHAPSLAAWLGYYQLTPDADATQQQTLNAVFSAAYEHGRGGTDVFGLRLQRHSFDFFMHQLSILHPEIPGEKSRLKSTFGNPLFIHLTRGNKLEQAISYVKATQTGLWHAAPDGTELERLSAPREPAYDAQAIAKQLSEFATMDDEWKSWFATEEIEPLSVTYDELSSAPLATRARILERLGLDYEPDGKDELPVAKLADATNQAWFDRFTSELSKIKT
ncbi:MAG: sulfotransferase [Rhodobacteraceae bacterium]|nr:sulfotransferase [Paracoccaceae bacterium]